MGMKQRRCPRCKKKRRYVEGYLGYREGVARVLSSPIDPVREQSKRDAGWRLIDGEKICPWCVAKDPLQRKMGGGAGGNSSEIEQPTTVIRPTPSSQTA